MLTPAYYTQMLYANNVGTKYIDADFSTEIPVTELAQSVTVNEEEQAIYVKLVNSSGEKQTVNLNLSGFENINYASNQHISAQFKSACNEVGKKCYVAPVDEKLNISQDSVITVEAEKYSVNVIRIAYGSNDGSTLYTLPDGTPQASAYLPLALKIAIPCTAGVIIVAVISAAVISKQIKKRKKNR